MLHLPPTVFAIRKIHAQAGFTLIELIVAITIMLVLLGGGIAGYVRFNEGQTLVSNARELQSYMRAAQKKARVGDKPTGCDKLSSYSVTANATSPVIVSLKAICENGTYEADSFTMASQISLGSVLNTQFVVLHGGVTNPQDVVVKTSSRTFTFTVGAGGEIGEGSMVNN